MRTLILALIFSGIAVCGKAQMESTGDLPSDTLTLRSDKISEEILQLQKKEVLANRFKIYPTENIYILLKLDTQTGRIDLIQWAQNSKDEGSVILNGDDLSWYDNLNSFELYPTKNIYQFILLDKATGRNWHVQWGTKSSELWIRRIF